MSRVGKVERCKKCDKTDVDNQWYPYCCKEHWLYMVNKY